MANIFEFLSKDKNITPEKARKSRQIHFRDKTAYVWGIRYRSDPSLSMNPVRRFTHFMPPWFHEFMIWLSSVGITWIDAPESQYASLNQDYKVWQRKYKYTLSNKSNKRNLLFIQSIIFFKIRCVVRANPPANIDWLKESLIISTGELDFQIGIDIVMFCHILSYPPVS